MSLFDESEREVLDLLFGSESPATYELGLSTAAPTEAGALSEVSGGGYARVTLLNNTTTFPAAATVAGVTTKSNGVTIDFIGATGSWGVVTHWFLYDPAGGRPVNWGTLTPARPISAGDVLRINAAHLTITLE
jgi:hypothetical protein